MLHDAGLSVAMGNAQADIKAQCDLITEDNDHNGVGEAIRRISRFSPYGRALSARQSKLRSFPKETINYGT